jgi:Zn-dependent M28 family amino/carboxypeptidase
MLPGLAEGLRRKPRLHNFEFVGFAAEEIGLLGSKAYVKALDHRERSRISAAVTLDSLGLSATKYWPNGSTQALAASAYALAGAMKLEFAGVNMDGAGTTDSETFQKAGVAVLSLHSVTRETFKYINSKRDTWDALSLKDYNDSQRFVSALLVYLDGKLP